MQVRLRVIGGKMKQPEYVLELPAIIGRSSGADVTIPDTAVSRQHCEIFEANGIVRIRDLGSTNGTCVGGKRVEEALLRPHDQISVGPATFEILYAYPDAQPAAQQIDATGSEEEPRLVPEESSELVPAEAPQDSRDTRRTGKHPSGAAETTSLELDPEAGFEQVLDDFFDSLHDQDLDEFLKGVQ